MLNYEQDTAYIIEALRECLDYSRIGTVHIALMQWIEGYRQAKKWPEARYCCEQLSLLARDPDMQNLSDIDTRYVRGIAQLYLGAILLSQGRLEDAIDFFSSSQLYFREANLSHSEAVALLALGIAYQRQFELGVYPKEHHWAETLKTLQRSLTIFRKLGDRRQVDVRDRLAEVLELFEKDLETSFLPLQLDVASPLSGKKAETEIPIVTRIAVGEPIPAEENIEDHIVVDGEIADRIDFALRVVGDSMVEAGILDGDLILIEEREDLPPNGQIVVIIVTQDEATFRRFYHEGDHIRLEPANDSYPFIIIKPDSLSEAEIHARYAQSHPKRSLLIYSGIEPQIVGWVMALIRRDQSYHKRVLQIYSGADALELFQNARYLGRAEIDTTIGKETRASRTAPARSILELHPRELTPDLTILILDTPQGKGRYLYRFVLVSPIRELNLHFEEAGEFEIQVAPEIYFEEIFVELNEWLRERDVDERVFFRRLTGLGANIYDQLFPDKLKRIYWEKLRDKVETVQIVSADPWIPWELVRPYHPDTLEEDNFFCEQFAMTRWLAGPSPPDEIDFHRLALVMAASDLPSAVEEAKALRQLPGIQVQDISPSLLAVYQLLETGGFSGLHFACHGQYNRLNPDQSVVLLKGGHRFRPNDIAGKKRTFGRDKPLVFLNACETGRAGFSLTGLGGWVRAFIQAGAGGFVGSIWEAYDESAHKFAVEFYRHLLKGMAIAEAVRLARRSIRRAGDPTWLSYTVYANPLARLAIEKVLQA